MVTGMQMAMRLLFAAVVGAIIGFERQAKGHPLGIRTNVLVCVSATTIMMLSKDVPQFLKEGGLYITSGIIIDRKDEVLACLENLGFKILKVHTKNNWVCIEATI